LLRKGVSSHGGDKHQPERAERGQRLRGGLQPSDDEPGPAGRLQRLAHRDERTEEDERCHAVDLIGTGAATGHSRH
jgi:hypothetical protein